MGVDYYKKVANNYDSWWNTYMDNTFRKLIQYLPASLENKKILDFGCGTGELIKRLLVQNPALAQISGYDPVEEMLRQAQIKVRQLPEHTQEKVKLQSHQNFGMRFDLIISSSVLHYLSQPQKVLSYLKSLLCKGGTLVLLDYTKNGFLAKYLEWSFKYIDSMHQQAYKPRQIRDIVEDAGFKAERSEEFRITPLWKGYVIKAVV